MSESGTERAERELKEATGSARARACVRARPAAAWSLRRAGGEGEGQVSVCGSRAPARGFPFPPPSPPWPWGVLCPFLVSPLLRSALPALPSSFSPLQLVSPHGRLPFWGLFPGQGDLWGEGTAIGSGPRACSPQHAALTRGRSAGGARIGKPPRPHTRAPQGNLPVFSTLPP